MHGMPTWSYLNRHIIAALIDSGWRCIAADHIGFGRSDKVTDEAWYSIARHTRAHRALVEHLNLRNGTLFCQDWGGPIGLAQAIDMPERFARLVIMNTGLPTGDEPMSEGFRRWREFAEKSDDLPVGFIMQRTLIGGADADPRVIAAYEAPFPDARYKAGAMMFPLLVPVTPDDPGSAGMRNARAVFSKWNKPVQVMFSDSDPITRGGYRFFRHLIPTAKEQPEITIQGASHFLQEDSGEEIARNIVEFVNRTPLAD
jgi:haloalkane dehalogenase